MNLNRFSQEIQDLLSNYLEDLEILEDGSWGPKTEEGDRVRKVLEEIRKG